jgi:endonuclease YncB( thermonuclease family)
MIRYLGDRFVNMEMVRDGFAWRYPQYDKPGEFTAAEAGAREHRRGLWADPNPVQPWEYRREKRSRAK